MFSVKKVFQILGVLCIHMRICSLKERKNFSRKFIVCLMSVELIGAIKSPYKVHIRLISIFSQLASCAAKSSFFPRNRLAVIPR